LLEIDSNSRKHRSQLNTKNGEKKKNTVSATETKITSKSDESRRTTGGFGPPFPHQIKQNYTNKSSVHRPTGESRKKLQKEGEGSEREVERGWSKNDRDEGVKSCRWRGLGRVGGLSRLIYQAYYIFLKCPLNIFEQNS